MRLRHQCIFHRLLAEGHLGGSVEGLGGKRGLGHGLKGLLLPAEVDLRAQPQLRVLRRNDFSAGFAESFVGAGVFGMPVRVEQRLHGTPARLLRDELQELV